MIVICFRVNTGLSWPRRGPSAVPAVESIMQSGRKRVFEWIRRHAGPASTGCIPEAGDRGPVGLPISVGEGVLLIWASSTTCLLRRNLLSSSRKLFAISLGVRGEARNTDGGVGATYDAADSLDSKGRDNFEHFSRHLLSAIPTPREVCYLSMPRMAVHRLRFVGGRLGEWRVSKGSNSRGRFRVTHAIVGRSEATATTLQNSSDFYDNTKCDWHHRGPNKQLGRQHVYVHAHREDK